MTCDVRVISTGGTFEKSYDPIREIFNFDEGSVVKELLRSAQASHFPVEVLMTVDSLNMSAEHRSKINHAIEQCGSDRVVLVHGTSRMVDTAEGLASYFPDKTIVLTGALRPYRYDATEASFNLGCAIASAQLLPPGTYIAIHGKIIPGDRAQKDPDTGQFSKRKTATRHRQRS